MRDLTWGLAPRGVALLRYDKRTPVRRERSAPDFRRLTVEEESVDDAVRALALARTLPGADSSRVFLVGPSLGGVLVPRIARKAPLRHPCRGRPHLRGSGRERPVRHLRTGHGSARPGG